jgi:hypothetical protein
MKRTTSLLLAALTGLANAAYAADTTPAKPSARGPGTQTEDELYIGSRAKAAPANATATKTGQAKQTAKAGKPDKIPDEDLQEIKVQRMKMQQNAR